MRQLTRRRAYRVAALVGVIGVLSGCAGDSASRTSVAGRESPESSGAAADVKAAVLNLSELVAKTPYYGLSDISLPANARDWAEGAIGLLRGEVVGVEDGEEEAVRLGGQDGEFGADVALSTVAFRVRVKSLEGEGTDRVKVGEVVSVLVPVFLGPPDTSREYIETYRNPILSAPLPAGIEALVPFEKIDGGLVDPSHILTMILATPNNGSATLLGTAETQAWGMTSLSDVIAAALAAAP
jgi:hypothetical protein